MQAAKARQRGLGAPLATPAIGAIAAEVIHSLLVLTRIEGCDRAGHRRVCHRLEGGRGHGVLGLWAWAR